MTRVKRAGSGKTAARRNQVVRASRGKGAARRRVAQWFFATLVVGYIGAILWTSLAYAVEDSRGGSSAVVAEAREADSAPLPTETLPFTAWEDRSTDPRVGERMDVRAYVQNAARAAGVNPSVAEWIVMHESQHQPLATGDGGESRGLWQISRIYHPEVSDKCAYSVTCSTQWSLRRIVGGNINEWSTWKYRKLWFSNAPK